MTKNEYLKKLSKALNGIPQSERKKSLDYFSELIDDRMDEGFSEYEAVAGLESVESAAARIISETRDQVGAKPKRDPWVIVVIVGIAALILGMVIYIIIQANTLMIISKGTPNEKLTTESVEPSDIEPEVIDKTLQYEGQDFSIELVSADIIFEPSEDENIHISYTNTKDRWFELSDKNGKIILLEKSRKNTSISNGSNNFSIDFGFFGFNNTDSTYENSGFEPITVKIRIPAGNSSSFNTNIISGDISISDIDFTKELILASVSGEISISDSSCQNFDAYSVSGDIYLSNVTGEMAEFQTTSGSVELSMTDFNKYVVETVSGDMDGVVTGSAKDYTVFFESVSGDNELSKHRENGPKTIDFSSVSGDFDIEFSLEREDD